MNKKIVQQAEGAWRWLDRHRDSIILANLALWPYILAGEQGLGITALILLAVWLAGKGLEQGVFRTIQDHLGVHPIVPSVLPRGLRIKISDQFWLTLKAASLILAHALLAAFFIAIFLYRDGRVTEPALKWLAVLTILIYWGGQLLRWEEDPSIRSILERWKNHFFVQKSTSLFYIYLKALNDINIALFPWVALGALGFTVAFGQGLITLERLHGFLLIYMGSVGLIILNQYWFHERGGILAWAGKIGAMVKTFFYFFVPGYLVFQLTAKMAPEVFAANAVTAFLIGIGALWLIGTDRLYVRVSLPVIGRSGAAFVMSYLKTLLKYSLILGMVYLAYAGFRYTQTHDLLAPFREPTRLELAPAFADLPKDHWAYPAMLRLYENGAIAPDSANFVHPGLWLNVPETLTALFLYFGIQPESFADRPGVTFAHIASSHEDYPVLKAAWYLGIVSRDTVIDDYKNRRLALKAVAILDEWGLDDPVVAAEKKGIVRDVNSLEEPLTRAVLAQMLYNLHLSEKNK